jgi:hypothetical protein
MRRRDQCPREDRERVEGSESSDRPSSNAMKLFKKLARRLVNVPRPELQQQQERYDVENAARRNRRKRKDSP